MLQIGSFDCLINEGYLSSEYLTLEVVRLQEVDENLETADVSDGHLVDLGREIMVFETSQSHDRSSLVASLTNKEIND